MTTLANSAEHKEEAVHTEEKQERNSEAEDVEVEKMITNRNRCGKQRQLKDRGKEREWERYPETDSDRGGFRP